jgi:hypothetical protein
MTLPDVASLNVSLYALLRYAARDTFMDVSVMLRLTPLLY